MHIWQRQKLVPNSKGSWAPHDMYASAIKLRLPSCLLSIGLGDIQISEMGSLGKYDPSSMRQRIGLRDETAVAERFVANDKVGVRTNDPL